MTNNDADLAAGEESDAAQTRQLVGRFYADVYRYAYRLCGSPVEAEDVVQQTFLVAQQRLRQLREADKADRWLYAIARSVYFKSLRRRRPVSAAALELNVEEIPAVLADDPVDRERLQAALASLPDDHRVIVLMFYFDDLSYKEIASQLAIPIGTVMSRLSRAKARLRTALIAAELGTEDHEPGTAPSRGRPAPRPA